MVHVVDAVRHTRHRIQQLEKSSKHRGKRAHTSAA